MPSTRGSAQQSDPMPPRSGGGQRPQQASRPQGQGKTPERAQSPIQKYPHNSDPFVTYSDGEERERRPRRDSTGGKVAVAGTGGGGGDGTPPGSDGKGLPSPHHSRESTLCRRPPRSGFSWGDEESNHNMGISPHVGPSGIRHGPQRGGPPDAGPSEATQPGDHQEDRQEDHQQHRQAADH